MATTERPAEDDLIGHGRADLSRVHVDTYNARLRSGQGYLGDRVTKTAFLDIVDGWRKRLKRNGADPFGAPSSAALGRNALDKALRAKDLVAAGIVHAAVAVIGRLLTTDKWRGTERIVIGGGFRASRLAEIAIGRAEVALRSTGKAIELRPIRNDPQEAGLLGAAGLVPAALLGRCEAIAAIDVGGTNIRVGVIELGFNKHGELRRTEAAHVDIWRHAEERPSREQAVDRLIHMLRRAVRRAEKGKLRLAPVVGIGCPGTIDADGFITQGGQNLPGNWESPGFNLPARLHAALPQIGGRRIVVIMHNDAVVQGLSELPRMGDVRRWGVLTIGTGLGNARLTNRTPRRRKRRA